MDALFDLRFHEPFTAPNPGVVRLVSFYLASALQTTPSPPQSCSEVCPLSRVSAFNVLDFNVQRSPFAFPDLRLGHRCLRVSRFPCFLERSLTWSLISLPSIYIPTSRSRVGRTFTLKNDRYPNSSVLGSNVLSDQHPACCPLAPKVRSTLRSRCSYVPY